MKTSKLVATAVALSIGLGNVAFAQGSPYSGRGDSPRAADRDGRPGRMSERMPDRRHDRRADAYADRREAPRWDPRPSHVPSRQDPRWDRRDPRWNQHWDRGAGPRHDLYRGGRLPRDYRGSFYVVDDWRGHHLRQPPVGYHWVQTGGDYVLAAIATGVILSILLNH